MRRIMPFALAAPKSDHLLLTLSKPTGANFLCSQYAQLRGSELLHLNLKSDGLPDWDTKDTTLSAVVASHRTISGTRQPTTCPLSLFRRPAWRLLQPERMLLLFGFPIRFRKEAQAPSAEVDHQALISEMGFREDLRPLP